MTVAERLKQEGLEEGEVIRARKAARSAIIKGYAIEKIADITGLTEKEVDDIRDEML